ncbi:glycoside hydrolase family 127 protein [Gallaecimonas pentaromativorans]|uniref:Uncharacterized protein n=1 Tax=Gallaecimonas pentaromativorans TaxID=584787 RepID=A0A3N1PWB9_9GAMM|nr:glycoside hydrolase family 127 protein [Gallaecimonas pentaromativorans]ROQ28846.1 hypothetical protein EDC28_103443 [Gallaecimonas pentaromativorans]
MRKLLLALALAPVFANAAPVTTLPLQDVRLLPSPFKTAEDTNRHYLMELDADRLLAPYRREAGLPVSKPSYGNWEAEGLGGHMGGHYLSALSLMYASTGDKAILARLNYMVAELKKCQGQIGSGYLGGVPGGIAMWQQIHDGDIRADLFTLNDKWVPWYNLHKLFAGLRDAYQYTGNKDALAMLIKLSDWAGWLTENLSDAQVQQMLVTEHGGMNEIFADLFAITGQQKYLTLARRFSQKTILEPLERRQDKLDGLHANTQIPKVIGYERIGEVSGDSRYSDAAYYFWHEVVDKRSVSIGGNSVREHFNPKDDFSSMIEDVEGPESCNTYNMLKLARFLYQRKGCTEYVRYYERAIYNQMLSTQHPHDGGLVYFTPMRPEHYRVYSKVDEAMWCCVGSGIETHSKYGAMIYAGDADSLYVNLFIPSKLNWREGGVQLRLNTHFPDDDKVDIRIEADTTKALKLRYPTWVKAGALRLTVNGKVQTVAAKPGSYLTLKGPFKKGDSIQLVLPMHLKLEQLPDKSNYYSVLYGPIVLAAKVNPYPKEKRRIFADDSRMGHIADGQKFPLEEAPMFVAPSTDFLGHFKKVPGKLAFTTQDLIYPKKDGPETLEPFFRIHDSRYIVYWPYSTPAGLADIKAKQKAKEAAKEALANITVDAIAPGEQQPEADHYFQGEGSRAGVNMERHWRDATGWFSYRLNNPEHQAKTLRLTFFGLDANRQFKVLLDGKPLADISLDGSHGPGFFTTDFALPDWAQQQAHMRLRFEAAPGSIAGGLYGIRLLSQ